MADDRTIRVRFEAEVNGYIAGAKRAAAATAEFAKGVSGHGAATRQQMESVGKGALLMAGGITLALAGSVKAAIDWESAWAGVTKTVGAAANETAEQTNAAMGELEDGLRGLARTLPASHKEIAGVAEAAGQLGIQRQAIIGFTETMVALGVTTNLSADQAATGIAQIGNVMGTAQHDFDRFGATLVALGNVGASTESEILEMATRLAGAGKLVGASEADVLGLANAMSSMGIEAQLGGGAFSRVMLKIYSAVEEGGDKLDSFAEIAGMSATEFAAAFEADPMTAINAFVTGLDRIDQGGGNVIGTLADLGLKGTQDLQVLLKLKGAGDLWAESQALARQAWIDNTALAIEANKRYETTASQLIVLKNNAVDLGIDLGGVLLPALKGAAGGAQQMLAGFQAMPDVMKTGVVGIAGLSAVGFGLIGALSHLVPKVQAFRLALLEMGAAGRVASAALPWLLAIGAAVAAVSWVLGENAQAAQEADDRVRGFVDAMKEAGDAAAGTEDRITTLVTESALLAGVLDETDTTIHDMATAMSGSESGFETFKNGLLVAAEAAGLSDTEIIVLATTLDRTRGESVKAADEFERLGRVEDDTAEQTGGLTRAQKLLEKQTEDLIDDVKELIDANRAAVDPLFGMLDATRDNEQAQADLAAAMADGETSAAELSAAHQAAAQSALDMDSAALTLSAAIAAGTVNVDLAKAMLGEWVAAGLITQETADQMGVKFDAAAVKADALSGERVVTLAAVDNTGPVFSTIEERIAKLGRGVTIPIGSKPVGQFPELYRTGPLRAQGGPSDVGPVGGPTGTDTISAWLSPGEFVLQKKAVDKYGLGLLYRMNALGFSEGGWADPGTVYEDGSVRGGSPIPGGVAWMEDNPGRWAPDWNGYIDSTGGDPSWKTHGPMSYGGINHNAGSMFAGGAASAPAPMSSASSSGGSTDHHIYLHVVGGPDEMVGMVRKWVRTNGGGDVTVLGG